MNLYDSKTSSCVDRYKHVTVAFVIVTLLDSIRSYTIDRNILPYVLLSILSFGYFVYTYNRVNH